MKAKQAAYTSLQMNQITEMALAGVELINTWNSKEAGTMTDQENKTIVNMSAAVLASYFSNRSGIQAKQAAVITALRAAFLCGRWTATEGKSPIDESTASVEH